MKIPVNGPSWLKRPGKPHMDKWIWNYRTFKQIEFGIIWFVCYFIVPVFTRQTHSESPLQLFFLEKLLICLSKGLSHHFIK